MNERDTIVILPANRQSDLFDLGQNFVNRRGVHEHLVKLGFRVTIVDINRWPWNPWAASHSFWKNIDPLRAIYVLFCNRRAKVVLSNFESGSLVILAFRRLLQFKPLVIIHDTGEEEWTWRVRDWIARFCIERADAILPLASQQAEYIRKKYQPRGIVEFFHQQTDTNFYSPEAGSEEDFVLSVGDDSRDFATLKTAIFHSGVPIVLRTNAVMEDRDAFSNVTAIRERLSDSGLRELYRRAKVVAIPLNDTLHPGGITTLLEAYACGKAIAVSDSRGVRDYLFHEKTCLVVPCGDADAFREAVMRLLADEELRARLANGARSFAERELSQAAHADKLVAMIRRLAALTVSDAGLGSVAN
jgi:hypothetical protein